MLATRWRDLISATAICIATVDLPDPPFSLPTTITRADRARVVFSNDMSASKILLSYRTTADFLVRAISPDSLISRQPEYQALQFMRQKFHRNFKASDRPRRRSGNYEISSMIGVERN